MPVDCIWFIWIDDCRECWGSSKNITILSYFSTWHTCSSAPYATWEIARMFRF